MTLSPAFMRWCNLTKRVFTPADLPVVPAITAVTRFEYTPGKVEFSYGTVADTYSRIRHINFATDLFV